MFGFEAENMGITSALMQANKIIILTTKIKKQIITG